MLDEYQSLVLETYKRMRDSGELSPILSGETTTKLKKACLKVYNSGRYNPVDDDVLSLFFDVDKLECNFHQVISDAETDDFKSLWKHIKDKTETTDEKNSELLAWLIDFKPRPRMLYYKNLRESVQINKEPPIELDIRKNKEISDPDEGRDNTGEEKTFVDKGIEGQGGIKQIVGGDVDNSDSEDINNQASTDVFRTDTETSTTVVKSEKTILVPLIPSRYIITACIILLFIGSYFFVVWENSPTTVRMPNADEKCMYWDGDHYEPIKCGQLKNGVPIIKLNLQALKRQRRINLHDTMTNYSVGKVWHIKIGNNPEFYTDSGMHPVDTARRLRPMSSYVHTKYNSYPRYILTHLVWFICAAFFITLCGVCVSKIKRKKNNESSSIA